MKDKIILGIESSCDETAIAIIKNDELISNVVSTQISMHQKYGGVMPEVASRLHAENITFVLKEALETAKIKLEDVTAIAVTRGPGLIGALHVGLQTAKTLSLIYDLPLIPVHHLAAHIYACEYIKPFKFPMLAIVVSGGNTELVYMKDHLEFEIIGETKDDAIGECFDKVARVLGLPYPGGVPIDKLSKTGEHTYQLPTPLNDNSYNFSYSGLKTSVINLVNHEKMIGNEINVPNLCKSFQDTAINMITTKVMKAIKEYRVNQVVLAGGVSANSYLRSEMERLLKNTDVDLILPPIWCTTDNAAMIAKLGSRLYDVGVRSDLKLSVDPNWRIEDSIKDFKKS